MDKKNKLFIKRKFLNSKKSPSSGSIYAYSGPAPWDPSKMSTFLEIADCQQAARLHLSEIDSVDDFIKKLKNVVKVTNSMIKYLEKK